MPETPATPTTETTETTAPAAPTAPAKPAETPWWLILGLGLAGGFYAGRLQERQEREAAFNALGRRIREAEGDDE